MAENGAIEKKLTDDFLQVLLSSKSIIFQNFAVTMISTNGSMLLSKFYNCAASTQTREIIAKYISQTSEYKRFANSLSFSKLDTVDSGLERKCVRLFTQKMAGGMATKSSAQKNLSVS